MSGMDEQPSYGRVSVRNGDGEGGAVVSFPAPSLPDLDSVRVITGPWVVHLNGDGSGELIELEEEDDR